MLGNCSRWPHIQTQEETSEKKAGAKSYGCLRSLPPLPPRKKPKGREQKHPNGLCVGIASKRAELEWTRPFLNSFFNPKGAFSREQIDVTAWRCPTKQTCPQRREVSEWLLGGQCVHITEGLVLTSCTVWSHVTRCGCWCPCHARISSWSTLTSQPGQP